VLSLKTELKNKIIKEAKSLTTLFVISLVLFKIIFFKENVLMIIRTVSAFFWMFILPGFTFMYIWHEKLEFLERFIISVPISAATISILSYYISLMGLHVKYHPILIPLSIMIISGIIVWRKDNIIS
jgi:uncharacterized membrane protein